MPVWVAAGFEKISFVSPRDRSYFLSGHDCYTIGDNGYVVPGVYDRQLFSFTLAATKEACAVFEYDTICWPEFISQGIPPLGELASGVKHKNNDPHLFASPWFAHHQFLGLGGTYNQIIPFFRGIEEDYIADRITSEAINRSGVKVIERGSFSCNSYDTKELIEKGVAARKAGTLAVTHGVKTKEALDALMGA
jgi:hypothetical protein